MKYFKALLKYRLRFMYLFIKNGFRFKTICFYPEYPHKNTIIFKTCKLWGYNITTNLNRKCNLVINWENTTFRKKYPELKEINQKNKVLNILCKDISKKYVDFVFKQVFGYQLTIKPLKYKVKCVKKSDINAQKDGEIINCPVKKPDNNYVYLKLLNNQINENLVQDIRTPVYNSKIPFVYLRNRLIKNRFINTNENVILAEVRDIFSKQEIKKIILFCKKIGLDFGELDILRNRDDGKIYIVDVNTTPWGPPNHITKNGYKIALKKLGQTFYDTYIDKTVL